MNEEAGFIAALLAEPDDRVALLVYADWLDERNDPRGEFVRLLATDTYDPERLVELAGTFDLLWVLAVQRRIGRGSSIRVAGGPFADLIGEVTGLVRGGPDKAIVAVKTVFWGGPIEVEIDSGAVELAPPQK